VARWHDHQTWVQRPIHLPERKVELFEYELDEGNLRMLRALQRREGLPTLRAAMRECLGVVTSLVQQTEDGYEVVLRKGDEIVPCGIDALVPSTPVQFADEPPESGAVTVAIDTELERRYGYRPERAREFPDHHRYKACPVPDGVWIGEYDYRVLHPPNENGNSRIDCHFTFIREVNCTGVYHGQRGEKYRLSIWGSDTGTYCLKGSSIDFGALEIMPGTRFVLGTRTGPKLGGNYAGRKEWGWWNSVEEQDEKAMLARQYDAVPERSSITRPDSRDAAAPESAENDPLILGDGDIDAALGNPAPGATDKSDSAAGVDGCDEDDLPKP
jgi:hypothetical protein